MGAIKDIDGDIASITGGAGGINGGFSPPTPDRVVRLDDASVAVARGR